MPTLREIATASGLSLSTISRVVLGRGDVSDTTRDRVRTLLKEYGYPDERPTRRRGRPARQARPAFVGVVCPSHAFVRRNPFFAPLLSATLNALDALTCRAVPFDWPVDSESMPPGLESVSGAILMCASEAQVKAAAARFPSVTLDNYFVGSGADGVVPDYRSGAFLATRHLIERGHRRITVMSATRGTGEEYSEQFYDGARRALDQAGIEAWEGFFAGKAYDAEGGYQVALRLLARPEAERPTALMGNDHALLGALRAAQDSGLNVPRDVALLGMDDIELGRFSVPRLSTAKVDKDLMGRMAVERLLWRIAHPQSAPCRLMTECPLVLRDSC